MSLRGLYLERLIFGILRYLILSYLQNILRAFPRQFQFLINRPPYLNSLIIYVLILSMFFFYPARSPYPKLYLYPLPNHFFQPDGSGCCLATGLSTLSPCESTTPTRTRLRLLWSVDSWDSRLKRRFKASCEENEFHGIKQKSNNSHGDNWVISCQMLSEIWNYFTVLSELSDFLILKGGSKYAWRLYFARCVHFCFYHEIHFKVHIQCLYNLCTFMYTVCS